MCPTLVAIRRIRADWVFETNTPAVARPRACFRFTPDFTALSALAVSASRLIKLWAT
jgi:hypothetical protein